MGFTSCNMKKPVNVVIMFTSQTIVLVPELCSMTGLSDEAKRDFRVMKVRQVSICNHILLPYVNEPNKQSATTALGFRPFPLLGRCGSYSDQPRHSAQIDARLHEQTEDDRRS